MAAGALLRSSALPRRVAGEAVRGQLRMACNQRPRADHQLRIGKRQADQHQQVGHNSPAQPAALHFQLQNRKVATMCEIASTAKASVMGKCTTRQRLTMSNVRLSQ